MSKNYRDARDYQVRRLSDEEAYAASGLPGCEAGNCTDRITHELSFAYTWGQKELREGRHKRFVCERHAERWVARKDITVDRSVRRVQLGTREGCVSGGSYNYLGSVCYDDLAQLISRKDDLREMADRLAGLGYAEDAARETEELLVMLRQWQIRAEVRVRRLAEVWHAVEWWDSGDSSEERVQKALAAYRGEPGAKEVDDVG